METGETIYLVEAHFDYGEGNHVVAVCSTKERAEEIASADYNYVVRDYELDKKYFI